MWCTMTKDHSKSPLNTTSNQLDPPHPLTGEMKERSVQWKTKEPVALAGFFSRLLCMNILCIPTMELNTISLKNTSLNAQLNISIMGTIAVAQVATLTFRSLSSIKQAALLKRIIRIPHLIMGHRLDIRSLPAFATPQQISWPRTAI